MPPEMSIKNIIEAIKRPQWLMETLKNGQPNFEILKPYMPKNLNLNQLAKFMDVTFSGRLDEEKIKKIRDNWKGKLVIKGVESIHDVEKACNIGLDGIIVSNHGGRQVDVGQATIDSMNSIIPKYKNKIKIMMDSGIRGGADIVMWSRFYHLEEHMFYLYCQITQIMEQFSCGEISDFQDKIIK